jgi:hypothetical protein
MFKLSKQDWPQSAVASDFDQTGLPPRSDAENSGL